MDAGNLLFRQPVVNQRQEIQTAAGILRIYQAMGYDAVAVGPHDLAAGVALLQEVPESETPWLSANLRDHYNQPLFPASTVIRRANMQIGIIGLTGPFDGISQELILTDWRPALTSAIGQLRAQCQLLIVLSNLSSADNAELAKTFSSIDLLITADQQRGNIAPKREQRPWVVQTMNQGKSLGLLTLTANNNQSGSGWSIAGASVIGLAQNLPEDPRVAVLVQQVSAPLPSVPPSAGSYAGSSRCQQCHAKQALFWKNTGHAQAYAHLQQQRQNLNLDCLPCHVTGGHQQPGPRTTLLALSSDYQLVGCESCHGPGLRHAQQPKQHALAKTVPAAVCQGCHTEARDPQFTMTTRVAAVRCPPGRALP